MAASKTSTSRHESDRNVTRAKKPWPERDAQHKIRKPICQFVLQAKHEVRRTPMLQPLLQRRPESNPLGNFDRLPYDVRQIIWSSVAAFMSPYSSINTIRFKWPEKWAENHGPSCSGPKDLLALTYSSKEMQEDVFPVLKRQMQGKTFNISFSESQGVHFESVRCAKAVTTSSNEQDLTTANKSSVACQNVALSAFAKALPYVQYLNITVELEYDHHLHGNPQATLVGYIQHTCLLFSCLDYAHRIKEVNTNVRLHMDHMAFGQSTTSKPVEIRRNLSSNRSGRSSYSISSPRNLWNWDRSTAQAAGVFMAHAIAPLHSLARSRNFLGDGSHVTLSDTSCYAWNRCQTPACKMWDVVVEAYYSTLRGSTGKD